LNRALTQHVLICGTSTRAAAESAARSGFRVTTIDAFADLDQHPLVRALSAGRDFSAAPTASAMARAARGLDRDAVVYLSPFENHPRAVGALSAVGTLWGNSPDTLRRVRNPFMLASTLRSHGFAVPRVLSNAPNAPNDSNDSNDSNNWLLKPLRSGGGNRIRRWRGEPVPRTSYLQERIDGTPGSLVFAAAHRQCVPVGFSRQLVGDANFGAAGYRYCGSILASLEDPQLPDAHALLEATHAAASCIVAEFGLVGLNGLDFVARGPVPYPVEVNPRWSSSIEVAERAFNTSLFAVHVESSAGGTLPSIDCVASLAHRGAVGKAIVYARHPGSVGDTSRWLDDPEVRDVPRSGEIVRAGQPVCSIFAAAADSQACYRLLVIRAERIYAELQRLAIERAAAAAVE
jgi:predicted ATP-grasp superfamily ATP-dependent carboligase